MLRDKPSVVKERQRKTAVSALGHFLSWSIEMAIFMVIAVTHFQLSVSSGDRWHSLARFFWFLVFLVPCINFAVYPVVQVWMYGIQWEIITPHALGIMGFIHPEVRGAVDQGPL